MTGPTRRRFIGISAAAAGLALLPPGGRAGTAAERIAWRGVALGAPAEMILHHGDRMQAERLIARAVAEIARLERIFSLYRADSALSQLNRFGALAAPPAELVAMLEACRRFRTLGAATFDPTVQPLWLLHAKHFAAPGADPAGPARAEVAAALKLVGFDRVAFDAGRIAFGQRGMALTLNGIAQGFITDRIVDMLRAGGMTSTLADLGEIRAIGARDGGEPWRVGISGGRGAEARTLDLVDRAVATSGTEGFRFAGPASPSHLLDPRTGTSARRYRSVSVVANDATTADALSTAFSFLAPEAIETVLGALPGIEAHLFLPDGRHLALGRGRA